MSCRKSKLESEIIPLRNKEIENDRPKKYGD